MLSKFFTLALAGLAAAAPAFPFEDEISAADRALIRRQYPVMACSHSTGGIHVLALGGANTNNPKDYGYLGSLATSILKAIPGSTNVSVPYDKAFISMNPPTLAPNAVPDGMKTLKSYIVEYHHACPNTKFAIIGYSSGAVIMMNDLCQGNNGVGTTQINPLLASKYVVGVVAYGDETHTANAPFNKGTCITGNGIRPRDASLCAPFTNLIQSYCDLADPDCCVNTGNDVSVHFTYPAKYDGVATQFIVGQVAKFGGA